MSDRDDEAALEARRDELKKELADAMARAEAFAGAVAEMKRVEDELAEVVARLRLRAPRASSLLDRVQVASPCSADWDAMKGDERVRFCGSCAKNVYNLSAMPRGEAEALLREREAEICVRLYQRADGTVISGDCEVGVGKKRRRRLVLAMAGAGAVAASVAAGLAASAAREPPAVMGRLGTGRETHVSTNRTSPASVPSAAPTPPPRVVMGAARDDF